MQPQRRCLAVHQIADVMFVTRMKGVQHQAFLQSRSFVYLFVHAGIHLFPKARHAAHRRRMNLLDGHLDILRIKVDAKQAAPCQAIIRPCPLEHMGEGQKVHNHIPLGQRKQHLVVRTERRLITGVMQHDTFRLAGGARRVKDIGKVACPRFRSPLVHFCLIAAGISLLQEVAVIDGMSVFCRPNHIGTENDNLFQGLAKLLYPISHIVLILLADKEVTDSRVFDYIMHLRLRAGGIKGDSDHPAGKCAEIGIKTLGHILREHTDILLRPDARSHQRASYTFHFPCKLIPRYRNPYPFLIIAVLQGGTVAVFPGLPVNQCRQIRFTHLNFIYFVIATCKDRV